MCSASKVTHFLSCQSQTTGGRATWIIRPAWLHEIQGTVVLLFGLKFVSGIPRGPCDFIPPPLTHHSLVQYFTTHVLRMRVIRACPSRSAGVLCPNIWPAFLLLVDTVKPIVRTKTEHHLPVVAMVQPMWWDGAQVSPVVTYIIAKTNRSATLICG